MGKNTLMPADIAAPFRLPRPIDDAFDASFADDLARLEIYNKHHYRPNTYMHKWWARRCGSTFRLILKHLVEDEAQRDYYAAGGLEGKVILDPMMGGGTTLHEAIRLGAAVIGVDIDPIPVVQARATLADIPLAELEAAYEQLYEGLGAALNPQFLTHCPTCAEPAALRYLLYGSRRRCDCGPVVLVDSLVLRYEGGQPAVWLCQFCGRVAGREALCPCDGNEERPFRVIERTKRCQRCEQPFREARETPYYARYEPLVVVGQCVTHGLFFATPAKQDRALLAGADRRRAGLDFGPPESFRVPAGPKSRDLHARGIRSFLDLFSSRQLLYLHRALDLLPAFEPLIRLNLALLISTSLEFNSLLCGYKGARKGDRPGAIRHTFSYHAYTFPYTALENNPFFPQRASGTLHKLFHDRIRRARQWAARPRERLLNGESRFVTLEGERDGGVETRSVAALQQGPRRFLLHQGSAVELPLPDESVDFVVTDPPYYDSVQYADLARFFRVWLQLLVPAGAQWQYDMQGAAVDPRTNGSNQYTAILSGIFAECRRVLRREGGRLVFTFHHWNPNGWAALTIALARAGFRLVNRYVVHSENPVSVHIANLRSLTHDAILVLAPAPSTSSGPGSASSGSSLASTDRAGETTAGRWERPERVDREDSRQFCLDCATLLGWLLESEAGEGMIEHVWRRALD